MSYMKWSQELDTGIDVIDNQHRRIIDYINQLHHALEHNSREEVGEVLEQLVEYTLSHFAFEEDLQEQSGYAFAHAHKKVHDLFTKKMASYQERFDLGEDISRQLMSTLRTWLINHIKRDDADYVRDVKYFTSLGNSHTPKKNFFARLFGSQ